MSEYKVPGITLEEDNSLTWETTHGDTVTVWQSAPLGMLLNWHWNVKAKNDEIVGGGEGHPRRRVARDAALRHHPVAVAVSKVGEIVPAKLCFYDNYPCGKTR